MSPFSVCCLLWDSANWLHITLIAYLSQLSIFLSEISNADRGTIDMKHVKRDFSLKARVRPLGRLSRFW